MPKGKSRRGAHFTAAFQRFAQSCRSRESLSEAGKLGYRATLQRHPDVAFEAARQWRLKHPSYPELVMVGVLKQLKVSFEREWRVGQSHYTTDFYLPDTRQAIEVHSDLHTIEKKQQHDARKQELLRERGIPCFVVWDRSLKDEKQSSAVIEQIKEFVALGRERQKTKSIEIESQDLGLDLSL